MDRIEIEFYPSFGGNGEFEPVATVQPNDRTGKPALNTSFFFGAGIDDRARGTNFKLGAEGGMLLKESPRFRTGVFGELNFGPRRTRDPLVTMGPSLHVGIESKRESEGKWSPSSGFVRLDIGVVIKRTVRFSAGTDIHDNSVAHYFGISMDVGSLMSQKLGATFINNDLHLVPRRLIN